ncbi:MAG: outer membrane beta-barrel protein [Legionellaceae bacterium]|nr:outer membrane beta-barrel protein [Legionellaceae bacterium]
MMLFIKILWMMNMLKLGMNSLLLMLFSGFAVAGSMGDAAPDYRGFWIGAGGSYNYSTINGSTHINQVSSTPSSSQFLLSDNLSNHMAPVVNAGYYFELPNQWYLGAKFLYKYISQEQFDQSYSTTFTDGSYQTAGLRTKFIQDFYLLASGAYQFGPWLMHAGMGPAWATVQVNLNGDVLPPSSLVFIPENMSQSKTIIGGAGQVGFEYMLPNRFMVDISYAFLATPTTDVPAVNFATTTTIGFTRFSQNVNVVEQGINITLNKYF